MSRLEATFARLGREGRVGLIPYVTAGDPDLGRSARILRALDRAGADVIEVGVPFSDPLADGPEIQRASERALRAGATLDAILELVGQVRADLRAPVVLFSYANPIVRMGDARFAARAAAAGVDGVLVLDVPIEEAGPLRATLDEHRIDMIFLVSPTTTDARIARVAALGRGFVYAISRLGVTGARERLADGARTVVERIRRHTSLPVALGFGVSRPEHVREAGAWADAVVVGSALVRVIGEAGLSADLTTRVETFVRWLRGEVPAPAGERTVL